jgi:aerobic C4-dicarboxylate transport protein
MLQPMAEHIPALAPRRPLWRQLYFQVLAAILLGTLVGMLAPETGVALKPLGDGFIKLVKMIIAPVIFLSIVTGIARSQELRGVGHIALKALIYFAFASTMALIVGLIVANVVRPGAGLNIDVATLDATKISGYVGAASHANLTEFLLGVIPSSLLGALTGVELLPVLFVAIVVGVATVSVGEAARPFIGVLDSAMQVVFRLVAILMRAAPIGAFGAMAFTIGQYGVAVLANLAKLVATFYATTLVFVLVFLGLIARLAGFSILKLVRYLRAELLLVLGTSSSESALPSLIEKMERAGCRQSVVGIVVPAGYSFNLDGTNIYMTLAALFIAQATNVELSVQDQVMLLLIAMISSKGAAGVTGAGFITLAATLSIVPTVPVAGMALILGIDRFMSECRSLTNFIGNAVATIVVSAWGRSLDRDRLNAALDGVESPVLEPEEAR